jgi:hypothetical protein
MKQAARTLPQFKLLGLGLFMGEKENVCEILDKKSE